MGISTSQIRERALAAYTAGKGTQEEIASLYGVSTRTFQRWHTQFKKDGTTGPKPRGHRQAAFSGADLLVLDRLVKKQPDATLEQLLEQSGKSCSIMSVQRALLRLGYGLKKNAAGQRTKSSGRS